MTPRAEELYEAVNRIRKEYIFWIPPYFGRYGELEKFFCQKQMEIFSRYHSMYRGQYPPDDVLETIFSEFQQSLDQ